MTSSKFPFTTLIGAPGMTFSRSGEEIFIPHAACTSLTLSKRSLGSRISSSGLGLRRAFIFVTMGLSFVPTAILSSFFIVPL
jgi:hypothetical protein